MAVPQEFLPFSTRVREAFDFVFLHQTPLRLIHMKFNRYGCLSVHKRMHLYICPLHLCPLEKKYLKVNTWCSLIQRGMRSGETLHFILKCIIITCHLSYILCSKKLYLSPHDFSIMLEINVNGLFGLSAVCGYVAFCYVRYIFVYVYILLIIVCIYTVTSLLSKV